MTPTKDKNATQTPTANTVPTTFAAVLAAVNNTTGLSSGVQCNMRSAVERCAGLMGAQGLSGVVVVQSVARKMQTVTAAKLGFKSQNSLASFWSNLRRALRLAGIEIMDGRARTPLSAEWVALTLRLQAIDSYLYPPVSRFLHYASALGLGPHEVGGAVFRRFELAMRQTNLGSKAEKTIRNTARVWKLAQQAVPGWPEGDLGYKPRRGNVEILPWSTFPPTLQADAYRFVARENVDWLDDDAKGPLRPATQVSYLYGIRRAASIAVLLGASPGDLQTLADLVPLQRVRQILSHLEMRTDRTKGGLVEFFAVLFLMIGRDHVKLNDSAVKALEKQWRLRHKKGSQMSERTLARLRQFDDPAMEIEFLELPGRLMAAAEKPGVADIGSAKLARMAIFLSLLIDTCARQGDIVEAQLDRHLVTQGAGKKLRMWLLVQASEVKNDVPIRAELSYQTASMVRRYIDRYRPIHCAEASRWLFPRRDGSNWKANQACADLKDLVARYVGADMTPHVTRSLAGKIVLDTHPGAIGLVQQLLGHKSIKTTMAFYTHIDQAKTRASYQAIVASKRRGP